jgi:hypothetical protein
MLSPLSSAFAISFIEAIGTDPRYPPTEGWPRLVDQLIESISRDAPEVQAAQGARRASFPFEHPREAATSIAQVLAELEASPRSS